VKYTRLQSSVQRDFVRLRETAGEMLCLYDARSPTRRSYRAVLEVSPINLSLKAPDEQEAIIERFQALLKSLSFPLQVLVRNQRLDLAPYMRRLLADAVTRPPTWQVLAHDLAVLLQQLAAQRTLIERHVYVILPASLGNSRARGKSALFGFGRRRRAGASQGLGTEEQARQELVLRAEALSQQLAMCGLATHRLNSVELARLTYACLTPERALARPLSEQLLSGMARPVRVRRRSRRADARAAAQQVYAPVDEAEEQTRDVAMTASSAEHGIPLVPLPDLQHLVDVLAPDSIEVTPDSIRIGQEYACGIAVTTCPREVSFEGWLAPLFLHDEVMEIAFHYHPQDTASMKRQLRRLRAGHASGRRFNQRQGRSDDPDTLVAEEDLTRMLDDLARVRERVLDLGFYILARAGQRQTLSERVERILSVLAMLELDAGAHVTTFEQAEALHSCLPEARDELMRTQTLDATTLATMFPFLSNSLYMPDGVLMGITETREPVMLNPWDRSLENPHLFIGGVTGSGKSYLGKLHATCCSTPRVATRSWSSIPTWSTQAWPRRSMAPWCDWLPVPSSASIPLMCCHPAVIRARIYGKPVKGTGWPKRSPTCTPCSISC
jgi:hypothetical protein